MLAAATLSTLVTNRPSILFHKGIHSPEGVVCEWVAGRVSAFCIVNRSSLGFVEILCAAGLLLVVSGWRPRITGMLHWYISFSVFASISVGDGGDQAAAVLTLLLVPLTLLDGRRTHWNVGTNGVKPSAVRAAGTIAAYAIQAQVAIVYLDACLSKLVVPDWQNGTALYYYLTSEYFGMPSHVQWVLEWLLRSKIVSLLSWSVLTIEFGLGINILLAPVIRRYLFRIGVLFHIGIAVFIGIPAFAMTMFAALLLGLLPIGDDVREVLWISRYRRRANGAEEPAMPTVELSTTASRHRPPAQV